MRKFFISFFLVFCAPAAVYAAAPFGLLPGVEKQTETSPAWLLRKIVAGDRVCVQIQNDLEPGNNAPYLEMVRRGYNKWFSHAAATIEKAGRQEEFADLMPVLKQGVQVKEAGVDCSGPDLVVYVQSREDVLYGCNGGALACVVRSEGVMKMFFYPVKGIRSWMAGGKQTIISHELGHTLGLADQYKYGRVNAHEIYHTSDVKQSIMDGSNGPARFGCDDADGFINLLDIGVFGNSRGGREGWRSFCKTRNYSYVNGRPVVNAKYAVDFLSFADKGPQLSVFNNKGELVSKKQYSFEQAKQPYDLLAPFNAIESEKDRAGRTIHEKNARGEERFCSYTYERNSCIVVKGDKLLLEHIKVNKRNRKIILLKYYTSENSAVFINFEKVGRKRRLIFNNGKGEPKVYSVSSRGVVSAQEKSDMGYATIALNPAFGGNLQRRAERQRQKEVERYLQRVYNSYLK